MLSFEFDDRHRAYVCDRRIIFGYQEIIEEKIRDDDVTPFVLVDVIEEILCSIGQRR